MRAVLLFGALAAFGVAGLGALCGCKSTTDPSDAQLADDGSQAMMASSQSTNLTGVIFDSVSDASPAIAAAELIAPARLWPWSCVSRASDSVDPEVVRLTFDDCTGPFGLVHVDGDETVALTSGPGGALRAVVSSVSLMAEGRPVQHTVTADITFPSDAERDVNWQGTWSRTNEVGEAISHTADLQIVVDRTTGCRTANGTAATQVAGRMVQTVINIDGYKICRDATTGLEGCPSGTVVHTGMPSGRTVTVSYGGSATAAVTGYKGDTFEIPLLCVP